MMGTMSNRKKLGLLAVGIIAWIVLVIAGWIIVNALGEEEGVNLSFRMLKDSFRNGSQTISVGYDPKLESPTYLTFNSQKELSDAWPAFYLDRDQPPTMPSINFADEFIALASWGPRPNSCYATRIVSVRLKANKITCKVDHSNLEGPDVACLGAITYPTEMVAVSKLGIVPGSYDIAFVDRQGKLLGESRVTLP